MKARWGKDYLAGLGNTVSNKQNLCMKVIWGKNYRAGLNSTMKCAKIKMPSTASSLYYCPQKLKSYSLSIWTVANIGIIIAFQSYQSISG